MHWGGDICYDNIFLCTGEEMYVMIMSSVHWGGDICYDNVFLCTGEGIYVMIMSSCALGRGYML